MVHLTKRQSNLVRHQGGCHCGAVRFEALASPSLTVFECNCSICFKKQIKYFLVPFNQFKLVKGHHSLQTYSFNTHQAKYNFCTTCGVQPFHIPSSNPDAYGIAMHSLDEGTVKKVIYEKIDSKKGDQPKRKTSSSEKPSAFSLALPKTPDKSQEQPLRKTSFIALINSINSWGQGLSTTTTTEENKSAKSTQDSTTTTEENKSAKSTQDSTTTTEPSGEQSTLAAPATKVEDKSPQPSVHRKFIVTKVVEQSPKGTRL